MLWYIEGGREGVERIMGDIYQLFNASKTKYSYQGKSTKRTNQKNHESFIRRLPPQITTSLQLQNHFLTWYFVLSGPPSPPRKGGI
jgi:hypothetical protein